MTTAGEKRTIAIVGLGFVGLALAMLFVRKGFKVIGIEVDAEKVDLLCKGISYLPDLRHKTIQAAVLRGNLVPTTDYAHLRLAESVIICVPTPATPQHVPDLSFLIEAGTAVSKHLRRNQLIILESSTYPGTTREILLPLLEQSKLKAGKHFYLGYSPERIDPGNNRIPLARIPKVVSGLTPECVRRIQELYQHVFTELVTVSSPESAEFAKLLENSYRLINISFINEIAIVCDRMKLDVWEVIEAAGTKPYGFMPFYPGPGAGGHCIPVDPLYLSWRAKQYNADSRLIDMAVQINNNMPRYIVEQLHRLIPLFHQGKQLKETNILLYGMAYKRNTGDVRESAALELFRCLREAGAAVRYHDPYIPMIRIGPNSVHSTELNRESVCQADCVVIATDHSELPLQFIADCAPFIYDTRNMTKGLKGKAKIVRLGEGI